MKRVKGVFSILIIAWLLTTSSVPQLLIAQDEPNGKDEQNHHLYLPLVSNNSSLPETQLLDTSRLAPIDGSDVIPDQYIVVFKDSISDAAGKAQTLATQNNLTLRHTFSHALKGFSAILSSTQLAQLLADPDVAYIEQNRTISVKPSPLNEQDSSQLRLGSGSQSSQVIPTGIDRIDAELNPMAKIDGVDERMDVDVAVLDTGIVTNHLDLNVVGGINCSTGNRNHYQDGDGHGTHVAGIIAAIDNSIGVVGVAPGARLWAVRVLNDQGKGTRDQAICGVDWVAANAGTIDVANMSLEFNSRDDGNCGKTNKDTLHTAICNAVLKGVTFVVAAGNQAENASRHVPAAYDEVITVSAMADFDGKPGGLTDKNVNLRSNEVTCREKKDDSFACLSNFGADVDIIAPGVSIYSTVPPQMGSYAIGSGTSAAAPHVAGAAALYKVIHPSASPQEIKNALIEASERGWNRTATRNDPGGDDPDHVEDPLLNVRTVAPASTPTPVPTSTPTSTPGPIIATIPVGNFPNGLAMDSITGLIYVTNGGSNTVSVIDGSTHTVLATVPVGSVPQGVAVNPTTKRLYVANRQDNTVSVIDTSTNAVIGTVLIGLTFNGTSREPVGVGVNLATNRVYVANIGDGTISLIDGANNTIVENIQVTQHPNGVAVNPVTNRIYVTNSGSSSVLVFDGNTDTYLTSVNLGTNHASWGAAVNPATNLVYMTIFNVGTISIVDGSTNMVLPTEPQGLSQPHGIGVNSTTNKIYISNWGGNTISVIDGSTHTIVATIPVGNNPQGIGVNSVTNRIYVANEGSNTVSVLQDH